MLFALLTAAFASPPPLTWSGIDYSMVTMIGTENFNDPNTIFPGYLNKWNDLFIVEYTGILGRRTGTRITPSIRHLKALREQADATTQILRDNTISTEAQLSREEVISHVADAYSPSDGGTAITLIADQLNKPKRTGCYRAAGSS